MRRWTLVSVKWLGFVNRLKGLRLRASLFAECEIIRVIFVFWETGYLKDYMVLESHKNLRWFSNDLKDCNETTFYWCRNCLRLRWERRRSTSFRRFESNCSSGISSIAPPPLAAASASTVVTAAAAAVAELGRGGRGEGGRAQSWAYHTNESAARMPIAIARAQELFKRRTERYASPSVIVARAYTKFVVWA